MTPLPVTPLLELATRRGWSMSDLAEYTNTPRRSLVRWKAAGTLTERSADRVAVALGLVLRDLWPEHVEASWEAAEAARRERVAAKQRRYRAKHPDYLQRERERRRAAYEHGRHYETARQRRYYQANAERERARVREYERRKAAERMAS